MAKNRSNQNKQAQNDVEFAQEAATTNQQAAQAAQAAQADREENNK